MPSAASLRSLLEAPADQVAPQLLGALLVGRGLVLRLTEVEAYGGADDPGSHAARGPTARNATMFGPTGHLYCYLSYGIHVCANVSTGPVGSGQAVLLRAAEVVEGTDLARERRGGRATDRELARGPGRLGRCLDLGIGDDGTDLLSPGSPVGLEVTSVGGVSQALVRSGPRVGLTRAAERPWRFWIDGDRTVSTYRTSPRAASARA